MNLTDQTIQHIREYVGSEPDDDTLYELADSVTSWQSVALTILRQRRADLVSGAATTSFSLSGVLSVSMTASDLAGISGLIRDLEQQLNPNQGNNSGQAPIRRNLRR